MTGSLDRIYIQAAATNCEGYEELACEFTIMANTLKQYADQLDAEVGSDSITNIVR
jgi:hypothetical protein